MSDTPMDDKYPDTNRYTHSIDELPLYPWVYAANVQTIERERDALKAECAAKDEALRDYLSRCPNCSGVGWYMREGTNGEPEQEQCQWCDTGLLALSSNAGADLLAKAQSAARLAEALRKIAAPKLGGKEQQYIAQAALREFDGAGKASSKITNPS